MFWRWKQQTKDEPMKINKDEPATISIGSAEQPLTLYRTQRSGVTIYTTSPEETKRLREKFRRMVSQHKTSISKLCCNVRPLDWRPMSMSPAPEK